MNNSLLNLRRYNYNLKLQNKKLCSRCNKILDINDFDEDRRTKQGTKNICKECKKHEKIDVSIKEY